MVLISQELLKVKKFFTYSEDRKYKAIITETRDWNTLGTSALTCTLPFI